MNCAEKSMLFVGGPNNLCWIVLNMVARIQIKAMPVKNKENIKVLSKNPASSMWKVWSNKAEIF